MSGDSKQSQSAPSDPPQNWDEYSQAFLNRLHNEYEKHVKPMEERYKYDAFKPSWFEETIQNQRPFVTFFGPWSAGKTTFINHLLQHNYLLTGPQPTTAAFTVVLYGKEPKSLDGHVLANAKELPFRGLNEFGENFLNNFQGFQCPHELLKSVILIDTPGVLESAQDVHRRNYDYIRLARWFAERSDLIFVMFDPTKLDAGIELRLTFKHAFKNQESKIRIILNKADTVNKQELMRVYGSLFWNLNTMIHVTEPPRVFVGSFWDQPYKDGSFIRLFAEEKQDLLHELTVMVPSLAHDRKVSSLIYRAKNVLVHCYIIGEIRGSIPMLFGKEKAKRKALDDLPRTYERLAATHKINVHDFPPVEEYRNFLEKFDVESFPDLEKSMRDGGISNLQRVIDSILPSMLRPVERTAVADPRDPSRRAALQKSYGTAVRNQFEGQMGVQGSSDVVTTSSRPTVTPTSTATIDSSTASLITQLLQTDPQGAMAMMQRLTQPPHTQASSDERR